MSSNCAIRVEGIRKCYQIYDRPSDRLIQSIYPRLQRTLGLSPKKYYREFWALDDVSFEVSKGETIGVIGRNGSGKSTLLQIICGTLEPTGGQVALSGRLAALLELGSGFNPEFTGRENVYMNATVLGMTQSEIDASFDDILAFAAIGDFIDQPVKTYSSGMFVRLAFSVAVHIKPAILIVDEALSVGDIAFQNKCMKKIVELKAQGTSILFVSHDLSTVQIICDRVIWLEGGKLMRQGNPVDICQDYYAHTVGGVATNLKRETKVIPQQSTGTAKFGKLEIASGASRGERHLFQPKEDIWIRFGLEALQDIDEVIFAVSIYRTDGDWVVGQTSREESVFWPSARAGDYLEGALVLTSNCFAPGDYMIALGAYTRDHSICYALTDLAASFSIRAAYQTWGKIIHPCQWKISNDSATS